MMRRKVMAAVLAGVLGTTSVAMAQGQGTATLEQRADAARTAKDHVAVAREYRERGERFEARAQEHELAAAQHDRRSTPLQRKWPASTVRPAVKERQLAVEARRAAAEAFALADEHMRSSVEALADASPAQPSNRTN